jgi:pimeloyl-ACP methyl ester carboxylesterase
VDGLGQPPDRVPDEIRELVREMDLEAIRARRDPSLPRGRPIPLDPLAGGQLARLRMPVLAIAGALDASDVAAVAHHLEAQVPTATALIMPDVAHMIGLEAPDALARAILGFVKPLAPW